jgi:solute carrier family 25 protein 42
METLNDKSQEKSKGHSSCDNAAQDETPTNFNSSKSTGHEDVLAGLPKNRQILISLAAGAIAGGVAKSVIAPLDRAKINYQTNPNMRYSLKAAFTFIGDSYRKDGLLLVWRGNSATIARIVPSAAITYMSHDQYKRVLGIADVDTETSKKVQNSVLRHFMAGAMAGVTAECLTYPLDRARTMMAVTKNGQYRNVFGVFKSIIKNEGYMYLYRGFTPTIMGVIPYKGLGFLTYEKLKSKSKEYNLHLSAPLRLAFGAFAGLCGNLISYPFEIVRRRMQTPQHMKPHGRLYTSILASLIYIMWTEGVRGGLYKGITMNLFKNPIATGLSFTINDYCKIAFVNMDSKSKL